MHAAVSHGTLYDIGCGTAWSVMYRLLAISADPDSVRVRASLRFPGKEYWYQVAQMVHM